MECRHEWLTTAPLVGDYVYRMCEVCHIKQERWSDSTDEDDWQTVKPLYLSEPRKEKVDHPSHYNQYPVECIDIVELMNFNRGNAIKYIWRAGSKNKATEIEDLKKALWYVQREITRLEK
jgi:hypothetical protein